MATFVPSCKLPILRSAQNLHVKCPFSVLLTFIKYRQRSLTNMWVFEMDIVEKFIEWWKICHNSRFSNIQRNSYFCNSPRVSPISRLRLVNTHTGPQLSVHCQLPSDCSSWLTLHDNLTTSLFFISKIFSSLFQLYQRLDYMNVASGYL